MMIFQAHSFWGGGLAGLVSVVAPIAVACTYASIKHLRIAPTWMTGSSIPPSRARVPTKTSPPCGLAGFRKGIARVAGVGLK